MKGGLYGINIAISENAYLYISFPCRIPKIWKWQRKFILNMHIPLFIVVEYSKHSSQKLTTIFLITDP